MSANDPHSILNRDPNRGQFEQKQKITQQRYRAGIVPDWATKEHDNAESEFKRSTIGKGGASGAIKYQGLTADAAAIIIDTD